MANSFIDTTVSGKLIVNGDIIDGDNTESLLTRINKNYQRLTDAYCDFCELDCSLELGANWASTSGFGAVLAGNVLRINGLCSRNEVPTGNISNELMCTITINHEGRLSNIYDTTCCNSGTGNIASMYATASITDTSTTVSVYFSGTRSANTYKDFGFYAHLPVNLNPEYYY